VGADDEIRRLQAELDAARLESAKAEATRAMLAAGMSDTESRHALAWLLHSKALTVGDDGRPRMKAPGGTTADLAEGVRAFLATPDGRAFVPDAETRRPPRQIGPGAPAASMGATRHDAIREAADGFLRSLGIHDGPQLVTRTPAEPPGATGDPLLDSFLRQHGFDRL
jgi:hypothetical protein